MTGLRSALFVERRAYRQRRLVDAARMLPVLGFLLIVLPLLWAPESGQERNLALDTIYVFGVWAALIVFARLLSPRLGPETASTGRPED
jgi:hypothetical protein